MKKLIALLSFAALVGSVSASELWWTVNTDSPTIDDATGSAVEWTTARVMANKTGYNYGGEVVGSETKDNLVAFGDAFTDLGSYDSSGYYFYIELMNGAESVAKSYLGAKQGAASYNEIKGSLVSSDPMAIGSTGSVYSGFSSGGFTSANVVPEPTSGVLLAFGLMMLGLKRKRV